MANQFNKDAAIIAQNATAPAVALACAIIAANPNKATTTESALALYDDVHTHIAEKSLEFGGVQDYEDFINTAAKGGTAARASSSRADGAGQDPGSVTFNVGKHKGESIAEVHKSDPDYLTWAVEKMRNDFMVSRIKAFLAQQS